MGRQLLLDSQCLLEVLPGGRHISLVVCYYPQVVQTARDGEGVGRQLLLDDESLIGKLPGSRQVSLPPGNETHVAQDVGGGDGVRGQLLLDRQRLQVILPGGGQISLLPGDDPAAVVDAVRAALGDLTPYTVEVAAGAYRPPADAAPDLPLVCTLQEAGRELHGARVETIVAPTALDAGYLASVGIPAVAYGPGRLRLDGEIVGDECVALSETWEAARLYAYAILRLLGSY